MNGVDDIANIIQSGGCVVMGVGVTPERYRLLLQDAANQDYIVIGLKDSDDADYIASRICGKGIEPKSLSISDLDVDVYLIRGDKQLG